MNSFITSATNETLKINDSGFQFGSDEDVVEEENQTEQESIYNSEVSIGDSEKNKEVNPEVVLAGTEKEMKDQAVSKYARIGEQTEQAVQTNSAIETNEENNPVESQDANPKEDLPTGENKTMRKKLQLRIL